MSDREIVDRLQTLAGFSEVYRIIGTYRCVRKTKGGATQFVTVTIQEGPEFELGSPYRYLCGASSHDKHANGTPAPSIAAALDAVNWRELDG